MATKEIRDWVDTMNMVGGAISDVRDYNQRKDKESIRQQFIKDIPNKATAFGFTPEEGQAISGIEEQAPGSFQKLSLEMLQNRAKERAAASKNSSPFTKETLKARGVPDSEIPAVLALNDPVKQMKYISEVRGSVETARRQDQVVKNQKKEFGSRALKISDFENEADANINAIDSFVKAGTIPAEAGAAMYIGKLVQGGGVLTEKDVEPFKQKYGAGIVEGAMNFMTGAASGKMSEEHKAALKDLTATLRNKVKEKSRLQKMSLLGESDLIAPDAPDAIEEYAKRHKMKRGKSGWEAEGDTFKLDGVYAKASMAVDGNSKLTPEQKAAIKNDIIAKQKTGVAIDPARLQQLGVQ